ncbi:MAG TPA: DUF2268 domain-containing putative Zn-dependent protease [Vicinamibacterales bacterium]|nr:DUF2268 domain-containing putative Zn-dependent protease [Vicinamibacterales bacterium]
MAAHLTLPKWIACAVLAAGFSACRDTTEGVRTQFVGGYAFTTTERRVIARIAGDAGREVRRHLPALASQITLRVQSGKDVIPELGAAAMASSPDFVTWTVDADRPEGVVKIAESSLRPALFHEFHHLVRGTTVPPRTLMDWVVFEGMATAFERDFAAASPPWGQYPDGVATWVDELLRQPPETPPSEWLSRERDGRRWIGMRAGTYLVDTAMKRLNRTSADLISTPTDAILQAAHP